MATVDITARLSLVGMTTPFGTSQDLSSNILTQALPVFNTMGEGSKAIGSLFCSSITIDVFSETVTLSRSWSYANDFYNRIHITPSKVNLGNLTSTAAISFEVFNGYFTPKNLTSITTTGANGMTLAGAAAPMVFHALQSEMYQVGVSVDGPPDINEVFRFLWSTPSDTAFLNVTGRRIVVFPYISDESTKEVLEWKTQVLQSYNSTEQRVRLRKHPRQSVSAQYPIQASEMTRALNLLYGWLASRWAVPFWAEAQQSADLLSGFTTIAIDTTDIDIRYGSAILIWETPSKNVTAQVIGFTDSLVTIEKPILQDFTKPWIVPIRIGKTKGHAARHTTGYTGTIEIDFEFTDNWSLGLGTNPAQYLGEDVCYDRILKEGEFVKDTLISRLDVVDFGGVIQTSSPWLYTKTRRPFSVIAQGLNEVRNLREWLHRRAGKLKPFWMPTFENDLRSKHVGTILSSMTIQDDGYSLYASDRKHILISTKTGATFIRAIIGFTDIGSELLQIELDSNLNFDASEILIISFMSLYRIDSDRIELNWMPNYTVKTVFPVLEIEP